MIHHKNTVKMKVVYYGYRDWSFKIFNNLNVTDKYLVTHKDYKIINNIKPDLVFFVGWSDIVPETIIANNLCVCLHPSPLPKYRGVVLFKINYLKMKKLVWLVCLLWMRVWILVISFFRKN